MERLEYSKPEIICDCINCSCKNDCKYRHKFQRLPRECGGLGLCPNITETRIKNKLPTEHERRYRHGEQEKVY